MLVIINIKNQKVVQIVRRPFPGVFSIEGLFQDLAPEIESRGFDIDFAVAPEFSKGLRRRIAISRWAKQLKGELFHNTGDIHFASIGTLPHRSILTIHDLTMLRRMRGIKRLMLKYFWFVLPCRNVRYITVISEYTKMDLLRNVRLDPEKIHVIPDVIGSDFSFEEKCIGLTSPTILQLGTAPNKNLDRLIDAITKIPCTLRIVGRLSKDQVLMLNRSQLNWSNYLDLKRDEVVSLYKSSDIVSLVSTNEGFGLPILEGQAVGRPVITSNVSSMPEVAGTGACLVNPFDSNSIRNGILRIISDENYRRNLVALGRVNVQRFSTSRVAEMYVALYRKTLA